MTPAPGDGVAAPAVRPVLVARGLVKRFPLRERRARAGTEWVHALDGVDLHLPPGEALGLVGESGAGKSTVGRTILRLLEPDDGTIHFGGEDVRAMRGEALRRYRGRAQIVLQDPAGALNPRLTAGEALVEALQVHRLGGPDRRGRALDLLERVGLDAGHLDRLPHELSGGQRQRVCVARALAVEPELLVLDEPVAALDVSVRAQILHLLAELQTTLGLSYLFIAHDLAVVASLCHRVAVMYRGRIVEVAGRDELFRHPRHPYTRDLLAAAPRLDRRGGRRAASSPADTPPEAARPGGCPYHDRCRNPARDGVCRSSIPRLEGPESGRSVACFKAADGPGGGA